MKEKAMKSGRRGLMFWRKSREGPELVQECEAFLAGRYLFRRKRQPARVPPWIWLSTLAHGDRSDIEALAGAKGGMGREMAAASYLARELLVSIDSYGLDLRSLQRSLLIPLEVHGDGAESPWATKRVCTSVLAELKRARLRADKRAQTGTGPDQAGTPGRDADP
jgi:hypothetical protein